MMISLQWWRRPNFLRVAVGHVGHVGCDPQQSQLSITLANPEKFGSVEVRYLVETRKSCVAYSREKGAVKNLRIFETTMEVSCGWFFSFETQRNLWGSTRQRRAISVRVFDKILEAQSFLRFWFDWGSATYLLQSSFSPSRPSAKRNCWALDVTKKWWPWGDNDQPSW